MFIPVKQVVLQATLPKGLYDYKISYYFDICIDNLLITLVNGTDTKEIQINISKTLQMDTTSITFFALKIHKNFLKSLLNS